MQQWWNFNRCTFWT